MARLVLTERFGELNNWPGRLFQATDGTSVVQRTATGFAFVLGNDSDFPGFRISVTGTGFEFLDGEAVGGTMSQIVVTNGGGQTVLTLSNLAAGTIAASLAQFAASVFGSPNPDAGPGPDGWLAWNNLLSGTDTIVGSEFGGDRSVPGFNIGDDIFDMRGGDDYISGGVGNDTVFGGDGDDTLSYEDTAYGEGTIAFQGITVNVAAGTVIDPYGNTDTFESIEAFVGSRFNDTFFGGDGRDNFAGLRGVDRFFGGGDNDQVQYGNEYWSGGSRGIVVDLETSVVGGEIRGTIRDSFGQRDLTFDIERVAGTRFNDIFVGSSTDNVFWGGEGKDSYDGGAGRDGIRFTRWFTDQARTGVVVDLSRATNQVQNDGFGNQESVIRIEDVEGSDLNDIIKGNAGANIIAGGSGLDVMTGNGGNDRFEWYDQGDIGQGDRITDFAAGGPAGNVDRLGFEVAYFAGMTGTLHLVNGPQATQAVGTFIFRAGTDTLFWDPDGTGAAAAQAVVVLTGVNALSAANFELFV